jgi:outer membrane protein assembly factor BamA
VRYSGALGGFYDLNDHGRVIGLWAAAALADPLHGTVPFTELATLGGPEAMRGFVPGRLYGRSAAALTLQYRWPVWVQLDGSIQLSVGNVFDKHFEDFKPDLLRFSAAIGVESAGANANAIEILFGVGSEAFRHGGQITSLRFIFGTHYGF